MSLAFYKYCVKGRERGFFLRVKPGTVSLKCFFFLSFCTLVVPPPDFSNSQSTASLLLPLISYFHRSNRPDQQQLARLLMLLRVSNLFFTQLFFYESFIDLLPLDLFRCCLSMLFICLYINH